MPMQRLKEWLNQEKILGVKEPDCAVLATATAEGIPHSRVVAIREITAENLVFFTQRNTRKVAELQLNPNATFNFLFTMQQRQVILEGIATALPHEENQGYWEGLPRERQLRFSSYAPTSGQILKDQTVLFQRKATLSLEFADKPIPMSEYYIGFRFTPHTMLFYTVGISGFSEVIRYSKTGDTWQEVFLSP